MPLPLFEEWQALYEVEPWADERAEHLHAQLCHLISVAAADRVEPRPPAAFMPFIPAPRPKPQSEADMKQVVRNIAAQLDANAKPPAAPLAASQPDP